VSIWHRLDGTGTFAKVYEEDNVPTPQWGQSEYACVTVEGFDCDTTTPHTTLDKIGVYRPYSPTETITVDHDVFVLGTTFDVVADWLNTH
jgi:hypothetical protein